MGRLSRIVPLLVVFGVLVAALYWMGMGGDCSDPKPVFYHWSGGGLVYQCR